MATALESVSTPLSREALASTPNLSSYKYVKSVMAARVKVRRLFLIVLEKIVILKASENSRIEVGPYLVRISLLLKVDPSSRTRS